LIWEEGICRESLDMIVVQNVDIDYQMKVVVIVKIVEKDITVGCEKMIDEIDEIEIDELYDQPIIENQCDNCKSDEMWKIERNDRKYLICIHCGEIYEEDEE